MFILSISTDYKFIEKLLFGVIRMFRVVFTLFVSKMDADALDWLAEYDVITVRDFICQIVVLLSVTLQKCLLLAQK